MSSEALSWAIRARIEKSSTKNLLMIVADLANHVTGEVFASLGYLQDATGLSKRTVLAALDELATPIEHGGLGILERTDERKGATNQIPVYLFHMRPEIPAIPKAAVRKSGAKTTPFPKQVQKRPETGDILHGEEVQKRTTEPSKGNQEEEIAPPSPNGEGTPHGMIDLFGNPVDPEPEQPIEHFVMERWAELKAAVPVIPGITVLSQARLKTIHARDADAASAGAKLGISPREVWVRVFEAIPRSGWLCGRNPPGPNYSKPHVTDIDEVLRPLEFLKILEGAHDDRPGSRPQKYDPDSGRSYGPVEQASRSVLADRRARRAESRERGYPGRGAGVDHPRLSHNPG
ncbi:helix-turn-helix domain-containing protein [Rhizorhabdus wittichii]|uniref:Helix-turn-helix domain-containing protein n=1 Tax=Rhizorhabdus wittichii TaxID=160791 RepID=A0A975D006_9SPHN|nr:helix-turn-helix domain-containing protein [Rhizorhabdus wittichii]QTH19646.1 helix-turn-helix domain-containing protein [Rhizorhabdus wittichii]